MLDARMRRGYSPSVTASTVTGIGVLNHMAAKAVSSVEHDGFFASGVSSMGGRAEGALGLAGRRVPVRQLPFGPPTRLASVVGGSKPHTELHTMTKPSPSAPALTFHDTTFHPVASEGAHWLPATEIAAALGYADEGAISRIYRRHAEEFTEHMTGTVNLTLSGNLETEARIFSLRGAHLLGMFARTERAAEFRRWVLDILDRESAKPAALPAPIKSTIDRATAERIDCRAWTLAQAAYEHHRAEMRSDAKRYALPAAAIDSWVPREARREALICMEAAARLAEVFAAQVRDKGRAVAALAGLDYDDVNYPKKSKGRAGEGHA